MTAAENRIRVARLQADNPRRRATYWKFQPSAGNVKPSGRRAELRRPVAGGTRVA